MGFKMLSAKTKLILAFLLMCAMTTAIGVVGLSSAAFFQVQLGTLWGRDVSALDHLQQAQLELAGIGRDVRQMVIEPEEAEMRQLQRAIEQRFASMNRQLDMAEQGLPEPENKQLLRGIRESLTTFGELVQRIEVLALKNDFRGAISELRLSRASAQKVIEQVDSIVSVKRRIGADMMRTISEDYARARNFSITMLVVSVVVGIVLALVFSQWFAKALLEVNRISKLLTGAAGELAAASEEIASGAQEQAAGLEETAASLEELTSTVRQNAESATQASQLAGSSRDTAERGGGAVRSAVTAMDDVNKSSKRIADIITTIDEIAFQTNLLALNAAVEAARAGEQGRGFAVVAAEVRNLAQRTAQAAKEIKGLIEDSVDKVEGAFGLVQKSGEVLQEIVGSVKRVTDFVGEIAAASREQASGLEQANTAINQMDSVTQSNATQTEELATTAQTLAQQAERLASVVAQFHLAPEVDFSTEIRLDSAPIKPRTPNANGRGRERAMRQPVSSTTRVLGSGKVRRHDAPVNMELLEGTDALPPARGAVREY